MLHVTGNSIEYVINSFESDSIKLFKWFTENQMKANKGKCYFLIRGSENNTINVDGNVIEKSNCEKLLGVDADYKLKFKKRLDSILKNAGRKADALSRILFYMNFEKKMHINELVLHVTVQILPSSKDVSQSHSE